VAINPRILDSRLGHSFPGVVGVADIFVQPEHPTARLGRRVLDAIGAQRIRRLKIFAHGIVVANDAGRFPGAFVQVGAPGLLITNIAAALGALRGHFTTDGALVELFCCAMAHPSGTLYPPDAGVDPADSVPAAISRTLGVPVRAAVDVQLYRSDEVPGWLGGHTSEDVRFGRWEGAVWLYTPDGQRHRDVIHDSLLDLR
jgi:hypothetical protein